jgi:hypothetical protein
VVRRPFWLLNSSGRCSRKLWAFSSLRVFVRGAGPSLPQVWSRCKSRYFHNDPSLVSLTVRAGVRNPTKVICHRPKDGTRLPQSSQRLRAFSRRFACRRRLARVTLSASKIYCGVAESLVPFVRRLRVAPVLRGTALLHVVGSLKDRRAESPSSSAPA